MYIDWWEEQYFCFLFYTWVTNVQWGHLNIVLCISLFFFSDMAVPEPGEIEQSVCEAVGRTSETNLYFSDKEDLGLLLQVKYFGKKKILRLLIHDFSQLKKWHAAKLTVILPCSPTRLLQSCTDDSLNMAVPMRMLEIFSSEKTYLPAIPDANYVASLLEQILHYMVQKGWFINEVI